MKSSRNLSRLCGVSSASRLRVVIALTALCLIGVMLTACGKKESPEEKFGRLMTEAKNYRQQGKLEEAKINLKNAIDLQQNNPTGYFELAEVLTQTKQFREALENYKTALDLNPEYQEARVRFATFLLAGGEFEQAESNIKTILDKNPDNIEALMVAAAIDSTRKNFDNAKTKLARVLELSPDYPQALASLGDIAQREGNFQKAEEYLKQALEKDPKNEPIRVALADLYSRLGRFKDTEDIIIGVLNDNPSDTTLRFYFAEFLLERGLLERALSQYQQILTVDPLRHDARDRLFDNYLNRGETDKAKRLAEELIANYPKEPGADYFRGRLLQVDKKFEDALKSFENAMTNMPGFAPAFRYAGFCELALGKQAEAFEHLNQAIAIDPYDVGSRLTVAREAFLKRDFAQASEHVSKVLSRHPRQIGANIIRADIALIQGDLKTAEQIYRLLVETFPTSPAPHFKLALLFEKAEKKDQAIAEYRKVIEFDKEPFLALNRLAHLLVVSNGFDEAIKELTELKKNSQKSKAEFDVILGSLYRGKPQVTQDDLNTARKLYEEALQENPNLLTAYIGLAEMDIAAGNVQSAITRYENVIAKQPKHIPTHMLLAMIYESQSNYSKAADLYRKVLSISPNFAPAANNLAWLMAEYIDGDLNEALQLAQTAKREMPNEPSITDTLGWVYFKQKTLRIAETTLEEAVQLDSSNERPNPEILYHLAIVQNDLGNKEQAKETITRALNQTDPKHPKRSEMEALLGKIK